MPLASCLARSAITISYTGLFSLLPAPCSLLPAPCFRDNNYTHKIIT
ncbi:MAG: hypothetical protein F6K55_06070 [Moorea sp. SIO4A3]|nr:hypothetical protein [Moorena sp. SIO4A3]